MPLLGRHKSSPSSPTTAAASTASSQAATRTGSIAQQNKTNTPVNQQRAPICESPMFGIRRQLPVALHNVVEPQQVSSIINNRHSVGRSASMSATGRTTAPITTHTAMTTTIGSRQSINNNLTRNSKQDINNNNDNMVCLSSELNSIPQHITRQQIHYAFTLMDTNSDGLINLHDLSQMLANLGILIDEAILSHVMSIASKRGDRRMTESEFLEWLGNFIQISDSNSGLSDTAAKQTKTSPSRAAGTSTSAAGRRLKGTPLGRSSSGVGPSLAVTQSDSDADSPVTATTTAGRQRRGSGSGLALMRSLSSGVGGNASGDSSPTSTTGERRADGMESDAAKRNSDAARAAAAAAADAAEARSDLRAAFCVFDLDGDGYITLDEVRAGLELLGEQWSAAELSALFNKCNSNRDLSTKSASKLRAHQPLQRISIDDFVQLLL